MCEDQGSFSLVVGKKNRRREREEEGYLSTRGP